MPTRDIRQVETPWVRRCAAALERFNRRHPWSHNDHFHGWVVRNLPARRDRALEVGCGLGGLAQTLADQFGFVRAIDRDAEMVRLARARLGGLTNVEVDHAGFLDETGTYDVVTMIAVLHHMDLAAALRHAREVLRPGGRLLVVSLAVPESRRDLAWDVASAVVNPLVGIVKHPRVSPLAATPPPYPILDPVLSLREVRQVAQRILPGVEIRRRLFFRHTLLWEAPAAS